MQFIHIHDEHVVLGKKKLLLKVMHYNIALLPQKVTIYVT